MAVDAVKTRERLGWAAIWKRWALLREGSRGSADGCNGCGLWPRGSQGWGPRRSGHGRSLDIEWDERWTAGRRGWLKAAKGPF